MDNVPRGVMQTICSLLPLASAAELAATTRGLVHMADMQAIVASNVALWSSSQAASRAAWVSLQMFARAAPAAVVHALRAELRENVAAASPENFATKLRALSVNEVKAVCGANGIHTRGKKHQLKKHQLVQIERLVGAWSFGSLLHCPACMGRDTELQYSGGSSTPTMVRCLHFLGRGKPCGFNRQLAKETMHEVLAAPLRDTAAGDLASVGVAFGR